MRARLRLGGTLMPTRPKSPCPRCHHVRCVCEPRPEKRESGWHRSRETRERRTTYQSSKEKRRRSDAVRVFLAEHSRGTIAPGRTLALCPDCKRLRTRWVADHVRPIALGGEEGGPLRVHCRVCSDQQGSMIANAMQRR